MHPETLDHVAVAVTDRDAVAAWLCEHLDVHVIDRAERLTLIGPSATAGKITLLDRAPVMEGQRPRAVDRLVSIVLAERGGSGRAPLVHPDGLVITFDEESEAAQTAPRHSLVGVTLRADDPAASAAIYAATWGFEARSVHPDVAVLEVGGSSVTLVRDSAYGAGAHTALVDHLGMLVADAQAHAEEARRDGTDVEWVDAANTWAAFVTGPDAVRLEYVEHKPEFALV
jgi:hypothetical protein